MLVQAVNNKIIKLLEVASYDTSIVFVGGIAKYFMKNKDINNVSDIDIVINNIDRLKEKYTLNFMSIDRAWFEIDKVAFDIFIKELNEPIYTTIIDGIEIKHTAE
jgi:hypothetical protein